MPRVVPESIREQSCQIVNMLEAVGVKVPGGSRFRTYQQLFTAEPGNVIEPTNPRFQHALEGWIDVQLMRFILEHAPDPMDNAWIDKLCQCVGDPSIIVGSDSANAHGRNTQYELYVVSILNKAGMYHSIAEPDVVGQFNGRTFGVACKRLVSPQQLEKRVKKAIEQILKSELPGLIAIDLTVALNRERQPVGSDISVAAVLRRTGEFLNGFIKVYGNKIESWVETTWVRGVVFHYHSLHCEGESRWTLNSFTTNLALCNHNDRRKREFLEIVSGMQAGSPTPAGRMPTPTPMGAERAVRFVAQAHQNRWRSPR